ncbi:hypothetical protein ACIP1T_11925 [Pseudomonas japonica]|uniref:hypothetical protein n=1 Tax=Pseudomonas japonica TaxID=256466 RepID=UPI0037F8DA36
MSIIQDFDLGSLDTLLRSFTERPQALHLDTRLPPILHSLRQDHLDLLPLKASSLHGYLYIFEGLSGDRIKAARCLS